MAEKVEAGEEKKASWPRNIQIHHLSSSLPYLVIIRTVMSANKFLTVTECTITSDKSLEYYRLCFLFSHTEFRFNSYIISGAQELRSFSYFSQDKSVGGVFIMACRTVCCWCHDHLTAGFRPLLPLFRLGSIVHHAMPCHTVRSRGRQQAAALAHRAQLCRSTQLPVPLNLAPVKEPKKWFKRRQFT